MVSCFVKHFLYCDMFVYHSWEKFSSPRPSNKQLLGQLSDWKPFLSDASVVAIRGLRWSIKGFKWNSDHWKTIITDEKLGLLRNEPWKKKKRYWIGRLLDWQLATWSILMVFVNETAWFFLFHHEYSMPTHDQAVINKDFELLTARWNEVPDGAESGSFLRSNNWTQKHFMAVQEPAMG